MDRVVVVIRGMRQLHNYYTLDKPVSSYWDYLKFIVKIPFSLPKWLLSFLLARNITNIALNPTQVKNQKPVHWVSLSDGSEESKVVIVNVYPHEPFKWFKDYWLKLNSIISIPFLSSHITSQLHYDCLDDRVYIDQIVNEIKRLLEGKSTADKCQGKAFHWADIHLKGLERLDVRLRSYLFERLHGAFGSDEVDVPRHVHLNFFTLESLRHAVLDSVEVSTESEKQKKYAERKYVIACMARDQNYCHWIKDFNRSAQKIGCTVIGFNYRGIDYSQGMVWTQDNMIEDTLAQVQRLLYLGVKPENIGLEGMCLGAAVATLAAARLHEDGLRVKLYNERSFRTLPRLVIGYLLPGLKSNPWNPLNWPRFIFAALVYVILLPVMWLVGWYVDAESAWDRIPEEDKECSVVRDYHQAELIQDDGIIEDSWASMASLVDEHKKNIEQKIEQHVEITPEEKKLRVKQAKTHEFKVSSDYKGDDLPHVIPRRYLIQRNGSNRSMHDHMVDFFKEKWNAGEALVAPTVSESIPDKLRVEHCF